MPPAIAYPNLGLAPMAPRAIASSSAGLRPSSIVSRPNVAPGSTPFGRGRPTQLLGQADIAGLFSPFGPPQSLFDPILDEQVAGSQARTRAAMLAARLNGRGDPSLAGYASLQSLLGEQGNLVRILGAARAQQSGDTLNFYRDLFKDFAASGNRGAFAKP